MARAKLNPLLESLRGAIGDVVVKQYGTKTVITRRPVFRNRRFTAAQKACQARFREAALFAEAVIQIRRPGKPTRK